VFTLILKLASQSPKKFSPLLESNIPPSLMGPMTPKNARVDLGNIQNRIVAHGQSRSRIDRD
jgi:hypothetical protein